MSVSPIQKSLHRITVLYRGGGTVFLYLIRGDSVALVDTGPAGTSRAVLQPALAETGLALADVDLILNTHGHMDHAGGNREVKEASNALIYLHSGDLRMAKSVKAQIELAVAPLRALDFPADVTNRLADNIAGMAGEPSGADVLLSEGDVVDLGAGIHLRAIHTPGHTAGCVSYYWESEGVLLTGDAVQGQGSRPGVYPLYSNATEYRRSLAGLLRLDPRVLCLGHAFQGGGAINDPTRRGEDARAFLLDSLHTADQIHRAVAGAAGRMPGTTKREILLGALAELIYQIPQLLVRETGMPGWAGPTLLAHLEAVREGSYPREG